MCGHLGDADIERVAFYRQGLEAVVHGVRWRRPWRRLWWRWRPLGDLGATRHVMLLGLVGLLIVAALHWQARVSCLYDNVAYGMHSQSGIAQIRC